MSKSNTLSLVQVLSGGQADPIISEGYYNTIILRFGREAWFVNAGIATPIAAGTAVYSYFDNVVEILAYFYDANQLTTARLKELTQINKDWRDEKGIPQAAVTEGESTKNFRLYPAPDQNPTTYAFAFGEPLGRGYPDHAAMVIYGERRDDGPSWMDLPLALLVLEREMERDSAHRDAAFAQTAGTLGRMLLSVMKPE